jgi:hypothetical protein
MPKHSQAARPSYKMQMLWDVRVKAELNRRIRRNVRQNMADYYDDFYWPPPILSPSNPHNGVRKVVINRYYGGFCLSRKAVELIAALKGCLPREVDEWAADRDDPDLVFAVESLGGKAAHGCYNGELKVVEIPDDVEFYIEDYDGRERVAEAHRTWF